MATGDQDFLTSQLDGMINMYNLWETERDNTTGLYYRSPLQDAQEYSLIGFLIGGPGGGPMQEWNDFGLDASEGGGNDYNLIWRGPDTYRPDFNAYMVAGAWAMGKVASLSGQDDVAQTWHEYGDQLLQRMENNLYSDDLNFWIDVSQETDYRAEGLQLIGYFPYRFGVGTNETYIRGLEAGLTEEHFISDFGPTTLDQSNPYFTADKNSTNCCTWNGQSWPFSTSVYLNTLARIARDNLSDIITPELFFEELHKYARTNYKDGMPYTAESHYPTIDMWSGDTTNHSENYLHSTYVDNIFTNLFGIIPTFDNELAMQPLVPSNWSYFAVENLPYHGTLLTLIWDEDGTHYTDIEAGFSIYSNGTRFHHQPTLGAVNVTLPFDTAEAARRLAAQPEWQNIAANPNVPYSLPNVTSSAVWNPNGDLAPYPAWKMNDGLLWYDTTPDNFWTNNQSLVPYATINITLPRARNMTSLSLAVFADVERGGVVDCPEGIKIWDGHTGQVLAFKNPWTDCVRNALNTVLFAPPESGGAEDETTPATGYEHETDFLQVLLSDKLHYTTALSEIQIWVPPNPGPRYEAEDGLIGTFIGGWQGRHTGLNGTIEDGGVRLGDGGWVELADVRRGDGAAGNATLRVIGAGPGSLEVGVNYAGNVSVVFEGEGSLEQTVEVGLWAGGNVVTLYQTEGRPWVDGFVVEG